MRCVKNFFLEFWRRQLATYQCLKMLLTREAEANDFAEVVLRRYTQCQWIRHSTFQL